MLPTFRLAQAIRDNCLTDANEAISAGADVNGRDHEGRTMLELAERSAATGNIIGLLLLQGADASQSIGRFNDSLFHIAARHHNYGFAAILVAFDHKPTRVNDKGETPLHVAASSGQSFLCALLIKHGVDVNLKDHQLRTASERALAGNHSELAQWLSRRESFSQTWSNLRVAESQEHTR